MDHVHTVLLWASFFSPLCTSPKLSHGFVPNGFGGGAGGFGIGGLGSNLGVFS
jgi:hypothetical protein